MENDECRMKWKNGRIEEPKNGKMKWKVENDELVSSFSSFSIYGNEYEEYVFCQ